MPLETVLCFCAPMVVDHRHFGGSTAHAAPSTVPELAALFKRPPSSMLAKMANLGGSRAHGARHDAEVTKVLDDDPDLTGDVYRAILASARRAEWMALRFRTSSVSSRGRLRRR